MVYKYYSQNTATNSIIITFLNGFVNYFTKTETEKLLIGFPYGPNKILMVSNEIASWLIVHNSVLLTLLTGFMVDMIITLYISTMSKCNKMMS